MCITVYNLSTQLIYSIFPQSGDVNLENVTHEDAVACLKSTSDRVVLVLGKVVTSQTNATPDVSPHPPQPTHQPDHSLPPRKSLKDSFLQ